MGHPYRRRAAGAARQCRCAAARTRRSARRSSSSAAPAGWTCTSKTTWRSIASAKPLPQTAATAAPAPAGAWLMARAAAAVRGHAAARRRVQDSVLANAGARPWDRDDIDRRILPTRPKDAARSSTAKRKSAAIRSTGNAPGLRARGLEPRHDGAAEAAAAPRAAEVSAGGRAGVRAAATVRAVQRGKARLPTPLAPICSAVAASPRRPADARAAAVVFEQRACPGSSMTRLPSRAV